MAVTNTALQAQVQALELQLGQMTALLSKLVEAKATVKAPVAKPVKAEKPPVDMSNAPSASKIDLVCGAIMRDKDTYKGKGIHPIVWSVGMRVVYRGQSASEAQVKAIQKIACENRAKYALFFTPDNVAVLS
jgi:hypothetical protein